jgi:outer membrane protein
MWFCVKAFFIGLALFASPVFASDDLLKQDQLILTQAESAINQNDLAKAKELIKQAPKKTEYGQVYGAFLLGRILENEGNLRDARDVYRAILNRSPNLARARLHLAVVLQKIGDTDGAKHNFEMVALGDIDKNLSDKIKTEVNGMTRAKKWQAQSSFSIVPTSNMTQGTYKDSVMIGGLAFTPEPTSRQKSGIGIQYGLEANYLHPLKDDVGLLTSFSTQHSDFSNNGFDDRTLRVGFGPQFYTNASVTTIEAVMLHRRLGAFERGYSTGYGLQGSSRILLDQKSRVTASASALSQSYDTLKYMEGHKLNTSLTYDYFTSSSAYLSATLLHEAEKTNNKHLNYQQFGGTLGYYFETAGAMAFYPNVTFTQNSYAGVFPLTDIKRKDQKTTAALTLIKKDWLLFGLAPKATLSYAVNKSNIELYDYTKFDVNLNFTKQF